MTKNDMLLKAARRAGIALWTTPSGKHTGPVRREGLLLADGRRCWNPFNADDDALRLAVAIPGLNLQWVRPPLTPY